MIEKTTDLVKEILKREKNINIAVDMTAENGNDSLFILEELHPKMLFAFDIQKEAKKNTEKLIGKIENFKFILDSHTNIDKYIKDEINLAIYNLGYLPRADKNITTKANSTLESLKKLINLISKNGKIIITVYPGHKEGLLESQCLKNYLDSLDQKDFVVLKLAYKNQKNNPPYVYLVGKK
jgi:rRNA methyltransferase